MNPGVDVLGRAATAALPSLLRPYMKTPLRTSVLTGKMYYEELLVSSNGTRFHEIARMSKAVFLLLLDKLKALGLKSSKAIRAGEKLLISIYILTSASNRKAQERFQHSGETISRVFGEVLRALGRLQKEYVVEYTAPETPRAVRRNPKWFPFFENCIGALDGTHVEAKVPAALQPRFRDRNGSITQNVLAVCSFDMRFTYVLAGWEGSAHDGRVLQNAYEKGFQRQGCRYYLGDAGYGLSPWVLTPYRGVRYHLKEFKKGNQKPVNMK